MDRPIPARAIAVFLAACALPASAPGQTRTVTVSDALSRARASSPFRAAAQARVDAAAASERMVTRFTNPAVEVRVENWSAAAPAGLPLDSFAVFTQPIELGGKPGARRDAQRAASASARAAAGLTDRDLSLEVVRRYVDVLRERDAVESLTAQRTSLGEGPWATCSPPPRSGASSRSPPAPPASRAAISPRGWILRLSRTSWGA